MRQSEMIDALAAAMVKAQSEIRPAKKDATNPHLKSKYADLASVWEAARETLGKHGLCVIQCPGKLENQTLELTTRLLHSSGQWLEETICLPVVKLDAQTCGGAITYARRYALSSMLGIVADDDDDGHSGTHQNRDNSRPQSQSRPATGAPPAGASAMAGAASTRTAPTASNSSPVAERVTRAAEQQAGMMSAPESRGDQQASAQPKLGLELDAKRETIRELLAEIDQRGVDLLPAKRQFAEHWAKNSALDGARADTIIETLRKALDAAPDANPAPGAFR